MSRDSAQRQPGRLPSRASVDRALSDISQPFGVDAAGFSRDLAPADRAGCTGSAQSPARARSRRDAAAGRTSRPGGGSCQANPCRVAARSRLRRVFRYGCTTDRTTSSTVPESARASAANPARCAAHRRDRPRKRPGRSARPRRGGQSGGAARASWATASSEGMTEVSSARGYPVTVNWTTNGASCRTASRSGSSGPMLRVQNTKPSTSPGRSETS